MTVYTVEGTVVAVSQINRFHSLPTGVRLVWKLRRGLLVSWVTVTMLHALLGEKQVSMRGWGTLTACVVKRALWHLNEESEACHMWNGCQLYEATPRLHPTSFSVFTLLTSATPTCLQRKYCPLLKYIVNIKNLLVLLYNTPTYFLHFVYLEVSKMNV